jgi:cyclic-di-GMP-binding protein
MSKEFSFDVVSDFDFQELANAIDQAKREITNRYDFKGVKAEISLENKEKITIETTDDYKIKAIVDIIQGKLIKRDLSLKILDISSPATSSAGGNLKKEMPLKKGLSPEATKSLSKLIRAQFPKVKITITGEELRIFSAKKDDLQEIINYLRSQDFEYPLQFINYR